MMGAALLTVQEVNQEIGKYVEHIQLTLQRRRTFKLLQSLRTEEFKFPTSSAPL